MGDIGDGAFEGVGVLRRWLAIAADLADELAGRGLDLTGRGRLVCPAELLDASAHGATVARVRLTRQRFASVVLAVVVGLVLAVVIDVWRVGGPVAWLSRHGLPPLYDARGRMVDIGGRSAYLDCRGSGSPTVVLENGLGAGAGGWGFVFDEVAAFARVCAWDRPGLGRSDPRGVHTVADAAADLRAALAAAGEAPPFVAVGHSLGGVYARVFASAHADEVVGLVFVDAFWPDIDEGAGLQFSDEFKRLQVADREATAASIAATEDLDWPASLAQVSGIPPTDLPAEILAVDQRLRHDDRLYSRENEAAVIAEWERQLGIRFPNGRITIVEGSGHVIQFDRPEAVIAGIRRVVDAVRAGGG
jgi:pimeloyl-ACP methyl ester carboxylesterase